MKIAFDKYQGTGNDFIIIDDRNNNFPETNISLITAMCHRHFGVGSDGLILIRNSETASFETIFFNPDGSKSLCGNGSRCAVKFAIKSKIAGTSGTFTASDGIHLYTISHRGEVAIKLHDIADHAVVHGNRFIDTGSPHLIVQVADVDKVNVDMEGRALRRMPDFEAIGGSNINFVSLMGPSCFGVRTYERGVEGETLSCGTGVTAVALAMWLEGKGSSPIEVHTHGGLLRVSFDVQDGNFTNIWLEGPAGYVYTGIYDA